MCRAPATIGLKGTSSTVSENTEGRGPLKGLAFSAGFRSPILWPCMQHATRAERAMHLQHAARHTPMERGAPCGGLSARRMGYVPAARRSVPVQRGAG